MAERLGQYILERRIGTGGMADVFLARGPRGVCVIKRPHAALCAHADFVRMFLDEASLLAQLNHPGIAQIYDLGQVGNEYFLAMEYVPGFDLMTMSLEHERQGEMIAVDLCARIIADAAAALHYAHDAIGKNGKPLNLIHRDISPHNILLSTEGKVKLIDFGVAKSSSHTQRTQAGLVKGKYAYMAPEQITGQAIDRRVDIYALGLVLYELLTNVRAIAGNNEVEQIENARTSRMVPIERLRPNLPDPIRRIVASCVHPDPAGRYQTALEVHDQLELFLSLERRVVGQEDLLRLFRVVAAEVSPEDRLGAELSHPTEQEQQAVGAVVLSEGEVPSSLESVGGAPTHPSMKMTAFMPDGGIRNGPEAWVGSANPPPAVATQGSGVLPSTELNPVGSGKRTLWPIFALGGLLLAGAAGWFALSGSEEKPVAPPPVKPVPVAVVDAGSGPDSSDSALALAALADAGVILEAEVEDAGAAEAPVQAAFLNVSSDPPAAVFVDGLKYGPAPQRIAVEAGKHTVTLANGELNLRYSTTVNVNTGDDVPVKVALKQGTVDLDIKPFGRVVLLGKELAAGVSFKSLQLYQGSYTFEISIPGTAGAPKKVPVVVKPGETVKVPVVLSP